MEKTLIVVLLGLTLTSLCFAAWEETWRDAFNDSVTHGETELDIPFGRVDIVTDSFAIEVDKVSKFHEAIGQALHYAYATKKKPGIAFFIEDNNDVEKKLYATTLAEDLGIRVWIINDFIDTTGFPKTTDTTEIIYHGNIESRIFHAPECKAYNCNNCTAIFHSREEAIEAGYKPCKTCNP